MSYSAITVRYRLTSSDYLRVLIWYQWKRIALVLGAVLFLMLLVGLSVIRPTQSEPYKRVPLYLAAVVAPIIVIFASYRGLLRQARKLESISEDVELRADPQELVLVTSSSASQTKWERFNKVVELDQYFVFFPQDNVFFVAPATSFEEAKLLDTFRAILNDSLGNKAKLKN